MVGIRDWPTRVFHVYVRVCLCVPVRCSMVVLFVYDCSIPSIFGAYTRALLLYVFPRLTFFVRNFRHFLTPIKKKVYSEAIIIRVVS